MRCNNCGWQNKSEKVRCEKCNYPLDGSLNAGDDNSSLSPPVSKPSNDPAANLSSTIAGSQPNIDPWDAPNNGPMGQPEPRPNSNEHRSGSNDFSPEDKGDFQRVSFQRVIESFGSRVGDGDENLSPKPIKSPSPPPLANNLSKTFDPSRIATNNGGFRLKLINKEGETVERELDFSGETVELNRDNVDPENFSITGKVQAVIEFIDGDWYLVDKSSLKTTYIQANSPFKLSHGDIILLGDRKIIFEE
ncbi:MAG: FHA domain-containing protein [Phaeodactylibacter xiamenensis]|uniref:FHA domain-containing protein n=1 Tax=Phaeodactylibacter xiamenensis TaxID=1524460 RepID=A0A098S154_9BACT|nr:FHA domain-containing protein [Phaeodactylibacter xiamenensis]KGE85825.1 hypothetical protein IX84_24650 [Phaeodactylibacter xiamenensis]MCR9051202.1 FHA domain-containing protein [bacterium]